MFDLKWSRKAETWDDVRADARALPLAEGLPVYPAGGSPMHDIGPERPQLFLAQTESGDLFLVDTQGYDYCRYAVRIPGLRIPPTR